MIGHDWGAGLLEQDNTGLALRGYFQTDTIKRIAWLFAFFCLSFTPSLFIVKSLL
jgi:hypothetical protein